LSDFDDDSEGAWQIKFYTYEGKSGAVLLTLCADLPGSILGTGDKDEGVCLLVPVYLKVIAHQPDVRYSINAGMCKRQAFIKDTGLPFKAEKLKLPERTPTVELEGVQQNCTR
jgi:hypothetical protein